MESVEIQFSSSKVELDFDCIGFISAIATFGGLPLSAMEILN